MSTTIQSLPSRYRSVPSIESLATSMDRLKGRNRELSKAKKSVNLVEVTVATQVGAALAGVGMAKGWSNGALGAAAGALAVAGLFTGQTALVHAANGALAPLVALQAASWVQQSKPLQAAV